MPFLDYLSAFCALNLSNIINWKIYSRPWHNMTYPQRYLNSWQRLRDRVCPEEHRHSDPHRSPLGTAEPRKGNHQEPSQTWSGWWHLKGPPSEQSKIIKSYPVKLKAHKIYSKPTFIHVRVNFVMFAKTMLS